MKLRYIFISILAVLLMSHNAFAEVLSIGVSPKWTNWGATWQFYTNVCSSGGWCWGSTSVNTIVADSIVRVKQIRFNLPNGLVLQAGDYITAEMVYNLEDPNNSNDMIFGSMKSNTSGIGLIDVTVTRGSNAMGSIKFTFKVEHTIRVTNTTTYVTISTARGSIDQYNIFWFNEPKGYLQGSVVNFYGTQNSTDYSGGINDLKNGVTNLNNKLNQTNDKLNDIKDKMQKEENTTNDNIKQGNDAADASSENAENATSSLISVIGQFVGAVTTASPSNCLINGNMGKVNMGQIDLCANPVPTFVQIISSLILIAICVPFAIIMFNRFINLFRSFQQ